jgi:hypothetical protein
MMAIRAARIFGLAAAALAAVCPTASVGSQSAFPIGIGGAVAKPSDRSLKVSDTTAHPGRYKVVYHDQGKSEDAGVISIAADGRLAIVSTPPRFNNAINVVVTNMNAMDAETVEAPPPPGAAKHSSWSRSVKRESPDFIAAMLADIRGYGFELIPESAP